ncbi:MAG TPA: phosphoribosylformylglycinamidine cyclo-ligase [Woeseiaceae bacterium]|jgi:phosphoribosylformylglycinamidine cyclo-ligase|nr:phosphoribosylformylglycinamidine cyclo-ligase [Woeseiaceae bacterium]|tara:strand:+ start:23110 stop:24135 length:1026 start_codon:yes stop_codon:yes gene_type:complete
MKKENKTLTYKDAGVDIDAGNKLVEKIKPFIKKTNRPEVMAELGGFGGLFALQSEKYKKPILVSGTDGVGTKLMLAQQLDCHESIGIDLVAMCVNDVLVQGAEPLFFLDYFACGKLDINTATKVINGIANGCKESNAALIGGETAEMPDMYKDNDYDLAGFCVGVVDQERLITGESIKPNDSIIGIASSGPHSNGYSLIRKVLDVAKTNMINNTPVTKMLLEPTKIYVKSIHRILEKLTIKGMAHITGGGITENIPRILNSEIHAEININSWEASPIFDWIATSGGISNEEMRKTFNCGIGMIIVVNDQDVKETLNLLESCNEAAWKIGTIKEGSGGVIFV